MARKVLQNVIMEMNTNSRSNHWKGDRKLLQLIERNAVSTLIKEGII